LKLRSSSEARKIVYGYTYFRTLGIDCRAIRDDTLDWKVTSGFCEPAQPAYSIAPAAGNKKAWQRPALPPLGRQRGRS
jgi:hypothetical protein